MAIMEKMVAESEKGLDINRTQSLIYFARLGVKTWRGQTPLLKSNLVGRAKSNLSNAHGRINS
jgi:hypothetical protein